MLLQHGLQVAQLEDDGVHNRCGIRRLCGGCGWGGGLSTAGEYRGERAERNQGFAFGFDFSAGAGGATTGSGSRTP